jgi:hypothetical protein
MVSQLTDRRAFIEHRLFEIQVEIERARHDVEFIEERLMSLDRDVTNAVHRRSVCETPVADEACATARGQLARMRSAAVDASERLGQLEAVRDGLLARLVG